ncbi:MAG: BrxA/BrxB family bacilliredoxin [Planctomycetes bacterium]|nr:BrxA/BrxB family bacilliredoxin [Planctomycetota bacterium]
MADFEVAIRKMREELASKGIKELKTPADVDAEFANQKGTTLLFVNSVCGCAAGAARPGLNLALSKAAKKPGKVVTVFAGQDKEATQKARGYFPEIPPSSPSAFLFKDGKVVAAVPRSHIEGNGPDAVAKELTQIFEQHC